MDRQLTERMVGAALLLGALVVVVPLILDGRGQVSKRPIATEEEAIDLRTHTIHLDGAERAPPVPRSLAEPAGSDAVDVADVRGGAGTMATAPAPPPPTAAPIRPEPDPRPLEAVEAEAAATPTPPPAAPVRTPSQPPGGTARSEGSAQPATVSRGSDLWYVQLGSFSSRANADRLAAEVRRLGVATTVSPLTTNGRTLYRVRAGGEPTREEAAALAERLAGAGHKGQLVRSAS